MPIPPEFVCGLTAEHAQAVGCGATAFDYREIDRLLGATEDIEDTAAMRADEALAGFRAALTVLIDLIIPPDAKRTPAPETLGIRLIALLQLVRPEALDGKSMNEIAKETGVTRAALSKMLVAYSDTFEFWARHQRSLKARKTYADVQKTIRIRRRVLRSAAARRAEQRPDAVAA